MATRPHPVPACLLQCFPCMSLVHPRGLGCKCAASVLTLDQDTQDISTNTACVRWRPRNPAARAVSGRGLPHDAAVQDPYKQQLEPMLLQYVMPAFESKCGHLRAKACWVAGQYADIDFRDGSGCGPTFNALFAQTVKALQDPDLPVSSTQAPQGSSEAVLDIATCLHLWGGTSALA